MSSSLILQKVLVSSTKEYQNSPIFSNLINYKKYCSEQSTLIKNYICEYIKTFSTFYIDNIFNNLCIKFFTILDKGISKYLEEQYIDFVIKELYSYHSFKFIYYMLKYDLDGPVSTMFYNEYIYEYIEMVNKFSIEGFLTIEKNIIYKFYYDYLNSTIEKFVIEFNYLMLKKLIDIYTPIIITDDMLLNLLNENRYIDCILLMTNLNVRDNEELLEKIYNYIITHDDYDKQIIKKLPNFLNYIVDNKELLKLNLVLELIKLFKATFPNSKDNNKITNMALLEELSKVNIKSNYNFNINIINLNLLNVSNTTSQKNITFYPDLQIYYKIVSEFFKAKFPDDLHTINHKLTKVKFKYSDNENNFYIVCNLLVAHILMLIFKIKNCDLLTLKYLVNNDSYLITVINSLIKDKYLLIDNNIIKLNIPEKNEVLNIYID